MGEEQEMGTDRRQYTVRLTHVPSTSRVATTQSEAGAAACWSKREDRGERWFTLAVETAVGCNGLWMRWAAVADGAGSNDNGWGTGRRRDPWQLMYGMVGVRRIGIREEGFCFSEKRTVGL